MNTGDGAYFKFDVKKSGTLQVMVFNVGNNKSIVVKEANGDALTGLKFKFDNGGTPTEKTSGEILGTSSGYTGFINFDVTAEKTYVFCVASSKGAIMGYYFTPTPEPTVTPIAKPTITATDDCVVTISAVEGGTVYYTTDGSAVTVDEQPSTTAIKYKEPFTVEDGTFVKAIAVADDPTVNSNSAEAHTNIWKKGGVLGAPVVSQYNGTFAATCDNKFAKIEYSTDNENWVTYNHPVTFEADTHIYVKVSRNGWTAPEAPVQADITALPVPTSDKTLLLGGGGFDYAENNTLLVGRATDAACAGFVFSIPGTTNTWNNNCGAIKVGVKDNGDAITRKAIHGSYWDQFNLEIADGYKVVRMKTFAVNPNSSAAYWSVMGENVEEGSKNVPMVSKDLNDPEIRVFNFDGVTGNLAFKHGGNRVDFAMELGVVYTDLSYADVSMDGNVITISHKNPRAKLEYAFVPTKAEGGEAQVVALAEEGNDAPTFVEVPADGKVDLSAEAVKTGVLHVRATHPDDASKVTLAQHNVTETGIQTGISEINADANAPVEYYNLQGVRVAEPANGIFLKRQGSKVEKVLVK